MARPRNPGSKLSYSGLGLDPEEDKVLMQLLKENDLNAKQLLRYLVRQWMKGKTTKQKP